MEVTENCAPAKVPTKDKIMTKISKPVSIASARPRGRMNLDDDSLQTKSSTRKNFGYLTTMADIIMPLVEKNLGVSRKDIMVLKTSPTEHLFDRRTADRLVSLEGFSEDINPVFAHYSHKHRLNASSTGILGVGLNTLESKTDDIVKTPIRYCVALFPSQLSGEHRYPGGYGYIALFFFIHKDFPRYRRLSHRLMKDKTANIAPILEDNLLKDVLHNTIDFYRKRTEVESYGVKATRGLIFSGSPGNGKTMCCRYIQSLARKHGIPVHIITSGDILDAFSKGELHELVSEEGIMFFDDVDISFFCRNGSDADSKMACAMLSALDGIEQSSNCIRIFTTNENALQMDPAFLRPGRIDKIFNFKLPNKSMRTQFLEIWHEDIRKAIDIEKAAEGCKGMSFAEMGAVRAIMVTNKIADNIDWDFERALKEFHEIKSTKAEEKGSGFFGTQSRLKYEDEDYDS